MHPVSVPEVQGELVDLAFSLEVNVREKDGALMLSSPKQAQQAYR